MSKILIGGLFMLLALAPAAAQMSWDNPGANPWRGTNEEALALFVAQGNVPIYILDRLYFAQQNHSHNPLCRTRPLRDGEELDMMLSGKDQILRHVTARITNWPAQAATTIFECRVTDNGHEYSLIYPVVCGNWAFNDRVIPIPSAGSRRSPVGFLNGAITTATTAATYNSGIGSPGLDFFGGLSISQSNNFGFGGGISGAGGSIPLSNPQIMGGPAPKIGSDELSALALLLTGMVIFLVRYFRIT
jgi:hypothetical protein